jgi:hypothetical protein
MNREKENINSRVGRRASYLSNRSDGESDGDNEKKTIRKLDPRQRAGMPHQRTAAPSHWQKFPPS